MAKKQSAESVYRVVDVVGVSENSWEDAGRHAVETAATSLRDLGVAEVVQMDMKVEDAKCSPFARALRCRSNTNIEIEGPGWEGSCCYGRNAGLGQVARQQF